MALLKNGNDGNGNSFMAINLYTNSSDSSEVQNLKAEIKTSIQNCVTNGSSSYSTANFVSMFKALVAADPEYGRGKALSSKDLTNITSMIYSNIKTVDDQIAGPGPMYNAAIGQGIDDFTPLQLVDYISTLANGGTRYKLHLVNKITDSEGNLIEQVYPQVLSKVDVSRSI